MSMFVQQIPFSFSSASSFPCGLLMYPMMFRCIPLATRADAKAEEIWDFWSIIVWPIEHCLLSFYISLGLVLYCPTAPERMGNAAAVERFLKVMAMVWAGSQVKKLVRAAGALALAPFVARGLPWFTAKLNFDSQWKAFMTIVGFCFGLALLLFFAVTLLWA